MLALENTTDRLDAALRIAKVLAELNALDAFIELKPGLEINGDCDLETAVMRLAGFPPESSTFRYDFWTIGDPGAPDRFRDPQAWVLWIFDEGKKWTAENG